MYYFRQDIKCELPDTQSIACKIIGLTQPTLSNILNGKMACRKVTAFGITKYLNKKANIENYFIKKGDK